MKSFLIGVSTHSLESAREARDGGADFVVFGPVFETESKRAFGPPQGLEKLREVTTALQGFPVLAIGGITLDNAESVLARERVVLPAISCLMRSIDQDRPVVLTIAGIDPSGGAGIVADIKTICCARVVFRRRRSRRSRFKTQAACLARNIRRRRLCARRLNR